MKYGFGADIGGTAIKLGFFREDGKLLHSWSLPTRSPLGGDVIFDDIAVSVLDFMRDEQVLAQHVLGLGAGIPGPVAQDGSVNGCVNLQLGVFNLRDELEARTNLRVCTANDANAAALGEYFDGGGKGSHSMLMVTLGTGIGGGFVYNGHVLNGAHGVAGELGHITVNRHEKETCTCGKHGCAEQYASATGIVRLAKRTLTGCELPSALRTIEPLSAKDVFSCAAQGDALSLSVLEQVYEVLGEAIADACCICDPELVVLGGGVSKAGSPLLAGVERKFAKYRFHASEGTRFALATLGNTAGIYGAFRLLGSR